MLSAANWGGQGLHTRGNFEAFCHAASLQKWLEAHGDTHWTEFYSAYGVALQKRFSTISSRASITAGTGSLACCSTFATPAGRWYSGRRTNGPARTHWTRFYLDPARSSLGG